MAKIKKWLENDYESKYMYFCPGCKQYHVFSNKIHKFNEDLDKPTITPSLLCSKGSHPTACHSYITDGKIMFLSDCEHELAGQTVELPEIKETDEELGV